jgi:Sulfotransferase domain
MAMSTETPASASAPKGSGPAAGGRAAASAATDAAQRSTPRTPDFFIVGHQKCGTTALYEMLKRHSQIYLPDVKEPRYFVPELLRPDRKLSTLDGYLELFAGADDAQRVGEASPQYIRSQTAARAIADMQPAARIVVILREPASFLRSFHLQMVQSNIEPQRDFRKALALVEARRRGERLPRNCRSREPLLYTDHVRYVEQLHRFYAVFAPEQVLVVIYDDFRRDNAATVRDVLRFLGVDDSPPIETVQTRPLKAVRSQTLRHLADSARTARQNPASATAFGRGVNALTPSVLRSERVRTKWRSLVYKQPPAPEPELMRELRRRLKAEVETLSSHLERDLVSEWGYDELG